MVLTPNTMQHQRLYGLIGRLLTHSFSERYFAEKFAREGIDARYVNFELPDIGDVMELVAENPDLAGFNVTIPYKRLILPYIDRLDSLAERVGAVNVVKIDYVDGEPVFSGYNSDVVGFEKSVAPLIADRVGLRALVLGTGGASAAVCCALDNLGISWQLVSRTSGEGHITYSDLDAEVMTSHRLIINTTPVGMYPQSDSSPDIPYNMLNADNVCFDLIYNPEHTLFMEKSAARGAVVANGLEMLHLQAEESWRIWNTSV